MGIKSRKVIFFYFVRTRLKKKIHFRDFRGSVHYNIIIETRWRNLTWTGGISCDNIMIVRGVSTSWRLFSVFARPLCPLQLPPAKRHFRRCHGTTACCCQTDNKTRILRCKTTFSVFLKKWDEKRRSRWSHGAGILLTGWQNTNVEMLEANALAWQKEGLS